MQTSYQRTLNALAEKNSKRKMMGKLVLQSLLLKNTGTAGKRNSIEHSMYSVRLVGGCTFFSDLGCTEFCSAAHLHDLVNSHLWSSPRLCLPKPVRVSSCLFAGVQFLCSGLALNGKAQNLPAIMHKPRRLTAFACTTSVVLSPTPPFPLLACWLACSSLTAVLFLVPILIPIPVFVSIGSSVTALIQVMFPIWFFVRHLSSCFSVCLSPCGPLSSPIIVFTCIPFSLTPPASTTIISAPAIGRTTLISPRTPSGIATPSPLIIVVIVVSPTP
mmetsp:Transcript_58382/g.96814  ORF Transcript_58382/g.96814 Transcript_58382/m.96814 type:complete len:273 (-) Transcript_58382:1812-2630(-)